MHNSLNSHWRAVKRSSGDPVTRPRSVIGGATCRQHRNLSAFRRVTSSAHGCVSSIKQAKTLKEYSLLDTECSAGICLPSIISACNIEICFPSIISECNTGICLPSIISVCNTGICIPSIISVCNTAGLYQHVTQEFASPRVYQNAIHEFALPPIISKCNTGICLSDRVTGNTEMGHIPRHNHKFSHLIRSENDNQVYEYGCDAFHQISITKGKWSDPRFKPSSFKVMALRAQFMPHCLGFHVA